MKKLSNITLKEFRAVLTALGLHKMRTKGDHEAWVREGLKRTVIIQTHVDPVFELVVRKPSTTLVSPERNSLPYWKHFRL